MAVVALQARSAEFRALTSSLADWAAQIQPMLVLLRPTDIESAAPVVAELYRRGVVPLVDSSLHTGRSPLRNVPGTFAALADELLRPTPWTQADPADDSAAFCPVLRLESSVREVVWAKQWLAERGTRVAVRLAPQRPLAHQRVLELATALGLRATALHIILDCGYVAEHELAEWRAVRRAAVGLLGSLRPERATILASAIPVARDRLGCRAELPRRERDLWLEVRSACPQLPVEYGDHGVVAMPDGPPGPGGRTPHPYLYYTGRVSYLFLRRRATGTAPGRYAEAFHELVKDLLATDAARPAEFSWGDRELRRRYTGSSTEWIAFATSHHLSQVAHETRAA